MDLTVNLGMRVRDVERNAPALGRPLVLRLSLTVSITAVAAGVSLGPFWGTDTATGVINLLVAVSFVAIGTTLRDDPVQRSSGNAMTAAALFWLMSWWWAWPEGWLVGPFPLLSNVLGYLWFVCGGLALLRYPSPKLAHRYERVYFVVLGAWICVVKSVAAIVSVPEWNKFGSAAWWPALLPNREAFDAVTRIFFAGIVVLAVAMLVILVCKLRQIHGMDRIDAVPLIVAACTVSVCGGIYLTARVLDLDGPTIAALRTAMGVAALVTPMAFLATVLRRKLAQSIVAELVIRLAVSPSVDRIQEELRSALQDPSLVLWFWLPREDTYATGDGRTAADPATEEAWCVPVNASDGTHLALLVVDASLQRYPALVDSVVGASGLVLENGRLHADVKAQLVEVRASRARIHEAGLVERRRIERDLHDGIQQTLLAANTNLGVVKAELSGVGAATGAVDQARANLRLALDELRSLARGIYPPVLSQSGLAAAVEGVAERLGIRIELHVSTTARHSDIEASVYFLTSEALTNVAKHAAADIVRVDVVEELGEISLQIVDDGCGGASPNGGSGLAGMNDRVSALGGVMRVDSRAGCGTTIEVRIPCE